MGSPPNTPGPAGGCGGRPPLLGVGIAPLGIVAIGVVPMGVVSIGVVPMGVISLGAVGMGLINATVVGMGVLIAGVNVMGVWWAGVEGMGPHRLGVTHPPQLAYPSRTQALEAAETLGCRGVHAMGELWMPCERHHKH
ncbi:MAG: hypothetical protein ACK5E6_02465 [Cyanobacteriota bacterium]